MRIAILTCLIFFAAGNCFGFNYYYDDVFTDGTTPFDDNNNWAPYDYPYDIGHLPSPGNLGEGGEGFDIEGLQVVEDDDYVYLALANSFGHTAYSSGWNESYRLGDLFIGTGTNRFAIDLGDFGNSGTTSIWNVGSGSWTGIQDDINGTYYGNTAIRNAAGAFEIDKSTASMVQGMDAEFSLRMEEDYETYLPMGGSGHTYVWELKFSKAVLGDFTNLDFHVVLGCGNDWLDKSYSSVPEPTSMLLLGLGLAGAGIVRKFRKQA